MHIQLRGSWNVTFTNQENGADEYIFEFDVSFRDSLGIFLQSLFISHTRGNFLNPIIHLPMSFPCLASLPVPSFGHWDIPWWSIRQEFIVSGHIFCKMTWRNYVFVDYTDVDSISINTFNLVKRLKNKACTELKNLS